jgi:xanthine dehydrogenase YagR molybdenum-binding subunit
MAWAKEVMAGTKRSKSWPGQKEKDMDKHNTPLIGQPVDRVDGILKVTGAARYAAEFPIQGLTYGVIVQSTITKGRILNIHTAAAEQLPGVLAILTHKNAMRLQPPGESGDPGAGKLGEKELLPLQSDIIYYNGQHIALVIAETFEQAEFAATQIKVEYAEDQYILEIAQAMDSARQPARSLTGNIQFRRGDITRALKTAEVSIEETYSTPVYHHNPMEPHATIAVWRGDQLTVYDSTQSVLGSRSSIARVLNIPPEKIRLISLFIGGGFGCKGFTWPHSILAPMAARQIGKPVKIVLDRQQMFTGNGRRARTIQQIGLGATRDGRLTAIRHDTLTETSFVDDFVETAGLVTSILYPCPDLQVTHTLVRINKGTPTPTRAPGEAPGSFAFEVALDELAYKLKIDPVEIRLRNYAIVNPENGKVWSSKHLDECYRRGADTMGWASRNSTPGSMREGELLVGYGMATACYPANRSASSARVTVYADGHAVAESCTQDLGTGTYTIMTQIVADALGLSLDKVHCRLGDSSLPKGANSGGSQTAASVGPPMRAAALEVRSKLIRLAIGDKRSPLYGRTEDSILINDGSLSSPNAAAIDSYTQILSRNKLPSMAAGATTQVSTRENAKPPETRDPSEISNDAVRQDEAVDRSQYAFHSFGAHFVKVLVNPRTGMTHVDHCVSVMDIGRVLNGKTARNQIMGGMIFGIGMALMEGTVYDPGKGRIVTRDLANYLLPVHADMPAFDIQFLDIPDPYISPIGARGIGEIGITGITAAIANAIYHATGKRIRDIPITPDKLL